MPTPLDQEAWDGWLYHWYFALLTGGKMDGSVSVDRNNTNATAAALRVEVDSKAMRKLTVDDVIFAAIQVIETGTATMQWMFNSRQLLKHP